MKIIEALKNLKTIQKRMEKNCQDISQYCAYVSTETPAFETEDKQREHVKSLVQANLDLEKEYLRLKKAIELTNLNVTVTIGTRTLTITELMSIRRVMEKFHKATYQALNANDRRLIFNCSLRFRISSPNVSTIIFYS